MREFENYLMTGKTQKALIFYANTNDTDGEDLTQVLEGRNDSS